MIGRHVLSLMIGILLVLMVTCSTIKHESVHVVSRWEGKNPRIKSVREVSGEYIRFTGKQCGRIWEKGVIGSGVIQIKINPYCINKIFISDGCISKVVTGDGIIYDKYSYDIMYHDLQTEMFVFEATSDSIYIPLTEIDEICIYSRRKGAIRGLWLGILGGAAVGEVIVKERTDVYDFWVCRLIGGLVGLTMGFFLDVTDKYALVDAELKDESDMIELFIPRISEITENDIIVEWRDEEVALPRDRIRTIIASEGTILMLMDRELYKKKLE